LVSIRFSEIVERRVFALERGAVFHQGPAAPLLTDLDYRKRILWL